MPEGNAGENWWERNVEDGMAELVDKERARLPEDQLLEHDVEVGALKGLYGGGKSLVTGLFDLGVFGVKVLRGDQATYEKIWDVTKKVAKEGYTGTFGTAEEKAKQNERAHAAIKELASSVKDKMQHDWDQAKKEGKTAELISHWTTRGVFEVATLVVGAGEVKAVTKAGQLGELSKIGEVGTAVIKCPTTKLEEVAQIEKVAAQAPTKLASGPVDTLWLKVDDGAFAVKKQGNAIQIANDRMGDSAIALSEVGTTEGRLDIVAHGSPSGIAVGQESLNAKQFASVLKRNGVLDGYSSVKLHACSCGADVGEGMNFAQHLANEIDMPVTAATRDVWTVGGKSFVADDLKYLHETNEWARVNPGEFVEFKPSKVP